MRGDIFSLDMPSSKNIQTIIDLKPHEYLCSDGSGAITQVGLIQCIFQAVKSFFGFTNYSHSVRISSHLLKSLYLDAVNNKIDDKMVDQLKNVRHHQICFELEDLVNEIAAFNLASKKYTHAKTLVTRVGKAEALKEKKDCLQRMQAILTKFHQANQDALIPSFWNRIGRSAELKAPEMKFFGDGPLAYAKMHIKEQPSMTFKYLSPIQELQNTDPEFQKQLGQAFCDSLISTSPRTKEHRDFLFKLIDIAVQNEDYESAQQYIKTGNQFLNNYFQDFLKKEAVVSLKQKKVDFLIDSRLNSLQMAYSKAQKPHKFVELAKDFQALGSYQKAFTTFAEAIKLYLVLKEKHPDQTQEIDRQIAACQFEMGCMYFEGERDWVQNKTCLPQDRVLALLYFNSACTSLKDESFLKKVYDQLISIGEKDPSAIFYYEAALLINPSTFGPHITQLNLLYLEKDQLELAKALFMHSLTTWPEKQILIAEAIYQKQFEKAYQHFHAIIQALEDKDFKSVKDAVFKAYSLAVQTELKKEPSLIDYQKLLHFSQAAFDINKTVYGVHIPCLIDLNLSTQKFSKVEEVYKHASITWPQKLKLSDGSYFRIATYFKYKDEIDWAEEAIDKALALKPDEKKYNKFKTDLAGVK